MQRIITRVRSINSNHKNEFINRHFVVFVVESIFIDELVKIASNRFLIFKESNWTNQIFHLMRHQKYVLDKIHTNCIFPIEMARGIAIFNMWNKWSISNKLQRVSNTTITTTSHKWIKFHSLFNIITSTQIVLINFEKKLNEYKKKWSIHFRTKSLYLRGFWSILFDYSVLNTTASCFFFFC